MTIIPAEKSTAAHFVSVHLADLLYWATKPDPNALSGDWLDAHKLRIGEVTESALRSFAGDEANSLRLRTARKLAFQFATLMHDRPKLSTIPVEEWHVQAYRQLFDDLSSLQREFWILSNTDEQPIKTEPMAAETPKTDSHPLSPPKEKWPREEYARDAIIRLKEKPELQSNILAFCRTIAEEQGVPEIAASLKKLLYQSDYQRLWKS